MNRLDACRRTAMYSIGCACALLLCGVSQGQSFGLQFQNDNYNFGPWHVSDFGPAYGVAGDDWYGSLYSSSTFDTNAVNGAVPFSSPAMNGASVKFAWASSNALQGKTAAAYGWSHANMTPGGVPFSANEAVLGGFIFSEYDPAVGQGSKIRVRISDLDTVAAAAGVPLSYQVKLLASSEWDALEYFPALVEDNASHSETVNFSILPDHPVWNNTEVSSGGMADTTTIFTGSVLDITIAGPNGYDIGNGTYGRSSLSGVAVYFVTPTVVPEPESLMLIGIGFVVTTCFAVRRRFRFLLRTAPIAAIVLGGAIPCFAQPSFGINWQSTASGFGPWNVGDFGSAYGVAGDDWFNSFQTHSGFDGNADAQGIVPFSSPSMNGASVNLKWSSDRFFGGQPQPVYGYSHANEPDDPNDNITPGLPSSAEEAVLAAALVSSYDAGTGLGEKIEVSISGLGAIASANGVPLQYKVKVLASDWGLPRPFYLRPYGNTHPDPGGTVDIFAPAHVQDNAANSESVDFTVLPDHPRWQTNGVSQGWDPNAPYFSSGAVGDSTTVFTGDTLTITLDAPFDFGGNWEDPTYGVTRLAGIAIYFVAPDQTGDFDGDGDVDGADFVIWQTNFPTTSGAQPSNGDADGDMDVDGADFAAWQSAFPGGAGSSPVPEPSAILLMAFGALAIGKWRFSRS